jgi:hypothetical protein
MRTFTTHIGLVSIAVTAPTYHGEPHQQKIRIRHASWRTERRTRLLALNIIGMNPETSVFAVLGGPRKM